MSSNITWLLSPRPPHCYWRYLSSKQYHIGGTATGFTWPLASWNPMVVSPCAILPSWYLWFHLGCKQCYWGAVAPHRLLPVPWVTWWCRLLAEWLQRAGRQPAVTPPYSLQPQHLLTPPFLCQHQLPPMWSFNWHQLGWNKCASLSAWLQWWMVLIKFRGNIRGEKMMMQANLRGTCSTLELLDVLPQFMITYIAD